MTAVAESLTMSDLRMAYGLIEELFVDDDEPLPSWLEGSIAQLETCRASIEVQAFGVMKYPTLEAAAAKLSYSTSKNHSFPNGNKRFAFVLILQSIRNGQLMMAPAAVGVEVAKEVADRDPHSERGYPTALSAYGVLSAQHPKDR